MSAIGPRPPRTVNLGGRDYRVLLPSLRDPRMHVAAVLLTLQVLGQTVLNFRLSIAQIIVCLITGALIEFVVGFFKDHVIMWPASGLLTGNSTAFILRVPGTLHGQWWSFHGIEIFIAVVAVSMASKYLIRWHGQHIFNPSNLGLVLAFVILGPQHTEPQDLWWIPFGPWLLVTYAILIVGGLWIGARISLLGMQLAFMAGLAAFLALALAWEPDHCMVASWQLAPICGQGLWQIVVTSPEVLVFAFFMVPDPRTVPEGRIPRIVFGLAVALFSVLLLGPTTLEFWTKTAILASLVVACGLRFPVAAFLARGERGGGRRSFQLPALAFVFIFSTGFLPLSADLSTRYPQPAAGLSDGSTPSVPLSVGSGPGIAGWVNTAASGALPAPGKAAVPAAASARVLRLPAVPAVTIPASVISFSPDYTPTVAAQMAHDLVLDLVIEAEARRTQDPALAATGAIADGLKPFTDDISRDRSAGIVVTATYSFDQASLQLFLPKFTTQASRLLGLTISGTVTLTTSDSAGHQASQKSAPYSRSWGLQVSDGGHQVINNDYTGLNPAG
jgi:hypothetical protein